jgi:hypothetical protein
VITPGLRQTIAEGGPAQPERGRGRDLLPVHQRTLTIGSYAGLVRIHIPSAASYRISASRAFWIDVVSADKLIAATGFTGQHGCDAPHKIVQFDLPAGELVLQLSGAAGAAVRMTLTRSPAAAR